MHLHTDSRVRFVLGCMAAGGYMQQQRSPSELTAPLSPHGFITDRHYTM